MKRTVKIIGAAMILISLGILITLLCTTYGVCRTVTAICVAVLLVACISIGLSLLLE